MNRIGGLIAAALAVMLALVAAPAFAEHLEQVGTTADEHHDKVYVDVDSVRSSNDYRIASVWTVYEAPRTNSHGIMMDRTVQRSAFDCQNQRISHIQGIAYLGARAVGRSPDADDWIDKFKPLPRDAISQRALRIICNAEIQGPDQAAAASANGPAPKPVVKGVSTGSGIIVDADGFVITNVHVANGCRTLTVKVLGSEPVPASIEAADPKNDLTLLKAKPGYGIPAVFRAEDKPVRLGEHVGVIGYPLSGLLSIEPKATFGEISSVAGINNDYTLLQFSAPVTAGNSGGPVFDDYGEVVGVVVSQTSLALANKIGTVPQNVNFAIRGELAQIFMGAHGIQFTIGKRDRKLETDDLAALGQKSTVQVVCTKG